MNTKGTARRSGKEQPRLASAYALQLSHAGGLVPLSSVCGQAEALTGWGCVPKAQACNTNTRSICQHMRCLLPLLSIPLLLTCHCGPCGGPYPYPCQCPPHKRMQRSQSLEEPWGLARGVQLWQQEGVHTPCLSPQSPPLHSHQHHPHHSHHRGHGRSRGMTLRWKEVSLLVVGLI